MNINTDNTENEPFVIRLLQEKNELHCRMTLLNRFNHSDKFLDLSDEEQALLLEQHRAMQKYYGILNKRCALYA
jgi:hypothetical protein